MQLLEGNDPESLVFAESLLESILSILKEANRLEDSRFQVGPVTGLPLLVTESVCCQEFAATCGSKEEMQWLLELMDWTEIVAVPSLKERLMEVIPNLCLGSRERMLALVDHFKPSWDFNT